MELLRGDIAIHFICIILKPNCLESIIVQQSIIHSFIITVGGFLSDNNNKGT